MFVKGKTAIEGLSGSGSGGLSGSPALRKALRKRSLSDSLLYVSFFSSFLRENLGCILSHCCPVNFFEKQVNYMNLN